MTAKTELQVALANARIALTTAKAQIKELVVAVKVEKEKALQAKATTKEAKRQEAIRKAQAKLAKLMDKANPVGVQARKAARKPGPVVSTKG
jgi:formate-dependent nitrite reductase cytochrome c552 subunit